ncbi:carbohydrate-binding family 9-like protein [Anaerobium acetethylicum]|uniref:Carbohydrate-binding family 9 n=1 Tax=Anaerobium acetethylicum TaxID=1619234 RepID=A0A1D3TZG7_9FIRM|nr:carbohydrate-binding family 9-like protein [Anaerobium acetethylicum]SCP99976.1 Carbohydrate-binding family 9 [Anaerobium acetethylicum]
MKYLIKSLESSDQISECPAFHVDHFNWGGSYRPASSGQLGFIRDQGFFLHMSCQENDPVCIYHHDSDPVYLDSAMEFFFSFESENSSYMNLEFNSAGALLGQFGSSRSDRVSLKSDELKMITRTCFQNADHWSVDLFIPVSLLQIYYPSVTISEGTRLKLNFYKIAEGEKNTHFASYSPIQSDAPNFHLPEFFADAAITG